MAPGTPAPAFGTGFFTDTHATVAHTIAATPIRPGDPCRFIMLCTA
jgi:hypothetical protein